MYNNKITTKSKECFGGMIIELSPFSKTILSVTSTGGHKISLNDTVVSNGRVFCPKDVRGRVIEIDEPHTNGTTDHVLLIDFGKPFGSYHMGFQDLKFEEGSYIFQKKVHTACKDSVPYHQR